MSGDDAESHPHLLQPFRVAGKEKGPYVEQVWSV